MRERLEKLREWLNAHSKAVMGGAGGVIVLCLYLWLFAGPPDGRGALPEDLHITTRYYYNTETKRVFIGRSDNYPPFTNEEGQECVSAIIYGCGGCERDQMFIAYYEKFTPSGQDTLQKYRSYNLALHVYPSFGDECLVSATAEPDTWHPSTSPEGQKIVMSLMARCREHSPLPCSPPVTAQQLKLQPDADTPDSQ